jgi:hypothetical protein
MSASFGDVVAWLLPLLIGGVVSLLGLLSLSLGRIDSGSGWVLRGAPAVVLGILALPALPMTYLVNPTLSQRTAWSAEAEEWTKRRQERLERKKEIDERDKEIAANIAALGREKAAERLKLQRQSLELSKEKLELTKADAEDTDRLGTVGRGRPRDPMPYLLPFGWGFTLYFVGWLLGRKTPAEEPKATETAPVVPLAPPDERIQAGPPAP